MKYLFIILSLFIFVSADAQGNRTSLKKGIQKCLDGLGDPIADCCVKTDANGEQYYISCDSLGDDWGTQVVEKDFGLIGDGTTGNELEVDTTSIGLPTYHYIDSTISTVGASAPISIYPAQITSNQNDYNPTGWATANNVYINSDDQRSITSFAAFADGTVKKIINNGRWTIFIYGEHPDGTAANRVTELWADYKLYPGKSMDLIYDGTAARCRILESEEKVQAGLSYEWQAGSVVSGDNNNAAFLAIGTGTTTASASTTSLPAAALISTSLSNAAGGIIYFPKSAITFTAFQSSHIYTECFLSLPTLSDGTDTYTIELQITNSPNSTTLEPNNTIGIRYSHGIASGDWELFSQDNAGSEGTPDDLDVAVAVNTTYKLGLWINKSNSEARAYINGNYVGRVTGSMPDPVVCGARVILLKSAGTTTRTLNVHNFSAGAIYK